MSSNKTATATFAGGCFWCMQPPFDLLEGVNSTTAGYAGGHTNNPTYIKIGKGNTGHTEVIQIAYDTELIGYQYLLEIFWRNIDPTTINQQFADIGSQYRSAIFYESNEQKRLAELSRDALTSSKRYPLPIVTEINPLDTFYPAEDYHQNYYLTNPERYASYHHHSGREQYLETIWPKK